MSKRENKENNKKKYFTITGLEYRYGSEFIEKDMIVTLEKDYDNEYDNEAIAVNIYPIGKIGYVANSCKTVIGDCMSAGRIYDLFGEETEGKVVYVLPQGVVCELI